MAYFFFLMAGGLMRESKTSFEISTSLKKRTFVKKSEAILLRRKNLVTNKINKEIKKMAGFFTGRPKYRKARIHYFVNFRNRVTQTKEVFYSFICTGC